jgi:hypothetical protein
VRTLIIAAIVLSSSIAAADSKPVAGSWSGTIEAPGHALAMTITFDAAGAGLIDIPAQHATGIPLGKVVVDGTHVTFELTVAGALFDGTLDHDAITGTMLQRGAKIPFTLKRSADIKRETYTPPPPPKTPLSATAGKALIGRWEGTAHDGSVAQPTAVTFEAKGDVVVGSAVSTASCEDPAPIGNLTLSGAQVHFETDRPNLPVTYADLKLVGDSLTGTAFLGHQVTVELHRVATPAAAASYKEIELSVASTGGTTLAGTLVLPPKVSKPAVVVLVTGSGPQNRDECLFGIRPFRQLADRLAHDGIATFRYDDRGTAKSTGNFATATGSDFADDAQAAVTLLAARTDVDTKHIGILGHSEGGMIGPMVAARDPHVAFLVLWAGPGVPLDQVILQQAYDIGLAEGGKPDELAEVRRVSEMVWTAFRGAKDEAGFRAALDAAIGKLAKADRDLLGDPAKFVSKQVATLWTPWFRGYNGYDPAVTIAKVHVPVLAIGGGMDKQVDAKTNLGALKKANPKVETALLPGLNHLFQKTKTGAVSEYAKNPPALDPSVLDTTSSWIVKHSH